MNDPAKRVAEEENAKRDHMAGGKSNFASSLMANNIRVSIFTLALGVTFGIAMAPRMSRLGRRLSQESAPLNAYVEVFSRLGIFDGAGQAALEQVAVR